MKVVEMAFHISDQFLFIQKKEQVDSEPEDDNNRNTGKLATTTPSLCAQATAAEEEAGDEYLQEVRQDGMSDILDCSRAVWLAANATMAKQDNETPFHAKEQELDTLGGMYSTRRRREESLEDEDPELLVVLDDFLTTLEETVNETIKEPIVWWPPQIQNRVTRQ